MPRGGKRDGAGRKPRPGSNVKPPAVLRREAQAAARTLPPAVVEQLAAEGPLPLAIMLKNMRLADKDADDAAAALAALSAADLADLGATPEAQFKAMVAKVKALSGLRMQAQACAKDAAPYCHAPAKAVDKPQTGDTITALVRIEAEDAGKVVQLWPKVSE